MTGERLTTKESLHCFECSATHSVHGKPLVFLASHLVLHDMTIEKYREKFPHAPTYSASYRRSRQSASVQKKNLDHIKDMQQGVQETWDDIANAFYLENNLLTAHQAQRLHGIKRTTLIMAVSRGLIEPEAMGRRIDSKTGETGRDFYLFSEEQILAYVEKMKKD